MTARTIRDPSRVIQDIPRRPAVFAVPTGPVAWSIAAVEEAANRRPDCPDYIPGPAYQPMLHGRFGWMAGAPLPGCPECPLDYKMLEERLGEGSA